MPTIYYCGLIMQPGLYFLARTHGDPMALGESIRRKLHEIEPARSVYDISPLTAHLSDAFAENRLRTVLLTFFALTAILLACVGLYGTLSYLVNMRRREVGLRLALGALRVQIVRQFLGQGMRVSLLGCVAGLGLAGAFTKVLAGMLFGVSPWDAGYHDRSHRAGDRSIDRGVAAAGHASGTGSNRCRCFARSSVAEAACAEVACGASGARRCCDSYLKTQESALGNPGLQMNCTWKSGARGSHRPAEPDEIACTGPRFNRHLGVL